MITQEFVTTFANYNVWQNESLVAAANDLDSAARDMDRGAFFGSITATFNHLLWADRIWLSRFADAPGPDQTSAKDSAIETANWPDFMSARKEQDSRIQRWSVDVTDADLRKPLKWYSSVVGRQMSEPLGLCIMHMYNHQTHHRGQIHAMLTAAGANPDATDIIVMPGLH